MSYIWKEQNEYGMRMMVTDHIPFRHGFLGVDAPASIELLAQKMDFQGSVIAIKQTHSTNCLVVQGDVGSQSVSDTDGILVKKPWNTKVLIGLKTADCMPVVIWNDTVVGVLHIGWRGVATRFMEKVLAEIAAPVHVAIGPHALAERYQITEEILPQFQHISVLTKPLRLDQSGSVFLSNAASIRTWNVAPICTMQDKSFHSHRRDGEKAGRNISFLIV